MCTHQSLCPGTDPPQPPRRAHHHGTLIGHASTLTTLDHGIDPDQRANMIPAPVVIGRKVWLGAAVTVVPGVTIRDGAIVGAGAAVTRTCPPTQSSLACRPS